MKVGFDDFPFSYYCIEDVQNERNSTYWTGRRMYTYIESLDSYCFAGYTNLLGELIDSTHPEYGTERQWKLYIRRYKCKWTWDFAMNYMKNSLSNGIRRPIYNRDDWNEYERV